MKIPLLFVMIAGLLLASCENDSPDAQVFEMGEEG